MNELGRKTMEERFNRVVQRTLALCKSEDDSNTLPGSVFGGMPRVPAGFEWPQADHGEEGLHPMSFIAQFDCAALAKFASCEQLPDVGSLAFFFDLPYEHDFIDWKGWVYYFDAEAQLAPASFPITLEEELRFPQIELSATERIETRYDDWLSPQWVMDGADWAVENGVLRSYEELDEFETDDKEIVEFAESHGIGLPSMSKMFGEPICFQFDPSEFDPTIKLLLQLDGDTFGCLKDPTFDGALYWFIREDVLRERRFDEAFSEMQFG